MRRCLRTPVCSCHGSRRKWRLWELHHIAATIPTVMVGKRWAAKSASHKMLNQTPSRKSCPWCILSNDLNWKCLFSLQKHPSTITGRWLVVVVIRISLCAKRSANHFRAGTKLRVTLEHFSPSWADSESFSVSCFPSLLSPSAHYPLSRKKRKKILVVFKLGNSLLHVW